MSVIQFEIFISLTMGLIYSHVSAGSSFDTHGVVIADAREPQFDGCWHKFISCFGKLWATR